jgi:hypothetical protein
MITTIVKSLYVPWSKTKVITIQETSIEQNF